MKQAQMQEAQRLYFQSGLSNTDIAHTVGISRRTLHYWIADNSWDRLRASSLVMPSFITEKVYLLMDQLADHLLSPDHADTPVTREEVDNLYKLSMTISKLKARNTINESMEVLAAFTEDIRVADPALAEQVAPYVDRHIAFRASRSSRPLHADRMADIERKSIVRTQDAISDEPVEDDTLSSSPADTTQSPAAPVAGLASVVNSVYSAAPSLPPMPKEKFDIRRQLRGTSSKGPGKTFRQQRPAA